MSIDIEASMQTQIVTENLEPGFFQGMQPLYSTKVVLTKPILAKNRARHSEMDILYALPEEVCTHPNYICRDKRDAEVAICYKTIGEHRLRVVLWLKQEGSADEVHNSILSFRQFHPRELELDIKSRRVVYYG